MYVVAIIGETDTRKTWNGDDFRSMMGMVNSAFRKFVPKDSMVLLMSSNGQLATAIKRKCLELRKVTAYTAGVDVRIFALLDRVLWIGPQNGKLWEAVRNMPNLEVCTNKVLAAYDGPLPLRPPISVIPERSEGNQEEPKAQ